MKRYIVNSIAAGLIFLLSCAKKEKIGPDLGEVKGPVEFEESFTVSTVNPNFTNGEKVYFNAKFKTDVHWVLTVVGGTSGAVRKFEGTGRSISPSNVVWDGSADMLPSFRMETAVATLSFPEASSVPAVTLSHNITIAGVKNLDYGHVIVTDFSLNQIQNVYDGNFAVVPANKWPSNFAVTTTNNDVPLINPDGNAYCTMGPQAAWQENPNFLGHNDPYLDHMFISATSVGYPTYFPLIGNPEQIYFNIMMYNNTSAATNQYTWLQVILFEDHPTIAGQEVAKAVSIRPNWNGWQLVSVPYTMFTGTGSTTNNPQKITKIQLVLLSAAPQDILDAATNPQSVAFDHIVFSHFKPYAP